jgi:hypothetical protein
MLVSATRQQEAADTRKHRQTHEYRRDATTPDWSLA